MSKPRPVLAAIDFSACSGQALAQASRIASWTNAPLIAVHVVNVPALAPVPPALLPMALPTIESLVASARQKFPAFARESVGNAAMTPDVRVGSPRDELVRAVTEHGAALPVLGATGGARRPKGVGTIASACVRKAPCTVMVVRAESAPGFKSVAACVDFSPTSLSAVAHAERIAAQYGSTLHIIHAYDDPWRGMSSSSVVEANMPDFDDRLRVAVQDRLREFCAPLSHELNALRAQYHGFQSDSTWHGHGQGLVGFLDKNAVDLAVLGVRSRWNVRDAVMGSTAERVFRDASCSILTVRAEAETQTPAPNA